MGNRSIQTSLIGRERWYAPERGSWLSPDPLGNRDSANLYAFAGGDPVNSRDATGEAVYLVYRQFAGGIQQALYPWVGHFYLAFDASDLPNPLGWSSVVVKNGSQEAFAGRNRTPERRSFPNEETFSFHPRGVNEFDDKTGEYLSTLYTQGSYVDYNDANDRRTFRRGREALEQKELFIPPFDRQYVWKIAATQQQQERLYLSALKQRVSINSGDNSFGSYCLGKNNCGSWAKGMIETAGLHFPHDAQVGNLFGVAIGGIADKTTIPATVTDVAVQADELHIHLDNLTRQFFGDPAIPGRLPR